MFTRDDIIQIEKRGSDIASVERQIDNFRSGFSCLAVEKAATPGDGIVVMPPAQAAEWARKFDAQRDQTSVTKFVPASGAATRMFKELFEFSASGKANKTVDALMAGEEKLPFYPDIKEKKGAKEVVDAILHAPLNYGAMPKALIKFHSYPDGARTAAEEHLAEAALYASSNGRAKLHFTLSPEHEKAFNALIDSVRAKYEAKYGVKYEISYSFQKPSTDTIAVTPDNDLFRNPDASLLFRPAGHGALIENLGEVEGGVIFVKNIDNVVPDSLKADTVLYKKALGGLLMEVREKIFHYIGLLHADEVDQREVLSFIENTLCYRFPEGFTPTVIDILAVLDRPLRLCGMVRNEGEPGGGPFWARSADGALQLQIAESAQIAPEKQGLMKESTHFNPVDLVCSTVDPKGERYDLGRFVDPKAGFISSKSKDGKPLKAQELPGLWNGAMSDWNTIFVEVPISTFAPVKEVTDLLRHQHCTKE